MKKITKSRAKLVDDGFAKTEALLELNRLLNYLACQIPEYIKKGIDIQEFCRLSGATWALIQCVLICDNLAGYSDDLEYAEKPATTQSARFAMLQKQKLLSI